MSTLSTHVLDTALGRPAEGISIVLEQWLPDGWVHLHAGITDGDGRIRQLSPAPLAAGRYRLVAALSDYFQRSGRPSLWPQAQIDVQLPGDEAHYHLPFLITPWSWSTYRGS
ncbi:hydroxyisourate hydrolase [Pantoea sp. 1.19]|uniref:hydroxyisourate hydrolase n=1 Tax=Pantoea sp. 1.19 TaxID=1925589 RepID=UPI000948E850|nr:hydroxyisourate hydrolase [Pantoea sp. 1.19]